MNDYIIKTCNQCEGVGLVRKTKETRCENCDNVNRTVCYRCENWTFNSLFGECPQCFGRGEIQISRKTDKQPSSPAARQDQNSL